MKKRLTNNLGLRLVAILIAFLLWLIVVNVSDPDIMKTFSNIEIVIENEEILKDANLHYEVTSTRTATVVLKGPRSVLSQMSSKDIIATANLRNLSAGNSVEIEYLLAAPYNAMTSSIEYKNRTLAIWLDIESIETRTYPLQVRVSGEPADGYIIKGYQAEEDEIEVTAPVSVLDSIGKIVLPVYISGNKEDMVTETSPGMYTKDGTPISLGEDTSMGLSKVSVSVDIAYTKEVPVTCEISGTPAAGYAVTDTKLSTESICLVGEESVLKAVNAIAIPADRVDVSGITQNREYWVDIKDYLPEGISIYNRESNQILESESVKVSVAVEAYVTKRFTLKKTQIFTSNIPKDYYVEFADDKDVTVTLTGLEDAFNGFDPVSGIYAYIDCSTVTESTTSVPLLVDVAVDGITSYGDVSIGISVRNVNEAVVKPSNSETAPPENAAGSESESGSESRTEDGEHESTPENQG